MDAEKKGLASYFEERLSAWKVYLPVLHDSPVLAVGFDNAALLSLARSWRRVHAWRCDRSAVEVASGMAHCQGLDTTIKMVGKSNLHGLDYHAIAVNGDALPIDGLGMLYRHLRPGGAIVYMGGRAGVRNFPSVGGLADGRLDRYALLPALDTKLIIPLASRALSRSGLNFYTPRRWHNRMATRLGGLVLRFGAARLLGGRKMLKVMKPGRLPGDAYLFGWLEKLVGTHISDATTFIGNNTSLQRRATLQLFDDTGRAFAVAKVGDTKHAREAALRESSALSSLLQIDSVRDSIPKTVAVKDWQGHPVSVQEFVPLDSARYSTKLTPSHLGFLESLCRTGQREMRLMDWPEWSRIKRWPEEGRFSSREDAELVGKNINWCENNFGGKKFVFHRVHGDFTPWNAKVLDDNTLMVLDWEFSSPIGLPFHDLVQFVVKRRECSTTKPLSIAGLFYSSAESLGVENHISALSRMLPNFNNIQEEKKRELLKAHLILIFSLLSMGKG